MPPASIRFGAKFPLLLLAVFILPATALFACIPTTPATTTVAQLVARPELYTGKKVTIEGFYFQTFETNVFCDTLQVQSGTTDYLIPKEPLVWVEGGLPKDVYDKLVTETRPNFAPAYYGKLRMTARFDYGGKYGHLGGFRYQLTIPAIQPQVEFLPWTPPTVSSK